MTNFGAAGVPDALGQSLSAHKDSSPYRRYSHPQDDVKRDASATADAYIERLRGTATTVTPIRTAR